MTLKRRILLTAVGAAAVSLAAATVAGAAPKREDPKYGGTLNVATVYSAINALTWNAYNWSWKNNHDGLYLDHLIAGDLDKGPRGTNENSFVAQAWIPPEQSRGELAESWEVKQDPLRIVFNLRKGVYWPEKAGVMQRREVVADDIIFHFTLMWTSPRKIPTYWDFIKEWKAEDKHTVVAYLNNYNANWGYRIAWGYYDAITPPEVHKLDSGKGANDWRNMNGTGPYKLVDFKKGGNQTYEKNADYWDKETINGKARKLPYNDKVVYHVIKDEAARIAALRTCKVDILEAFRWQFVGELKRSAPDLVIRANLATVGTFIALRNDQKPFDDLRVRRAMNMAVNQKEILDTLLNGEGAMLNYPFSKRWTSLYTPIEKLPAEGKALFDYDPEGAKALLAEAGYPKGFEFELMVNANNPYHMDMVAMLEAYYQKVGVKMKIKPLEYAAFRSQMRKPTQAKGYLMDNGEGNPFSVLRKSFISGQTWNPAMHADAKFDGMWKDALSTIDQDAQNQKLRDLNVYVIQKAPHVWLPTTTVYAAWWPYVKNYYGETRVGAVRPGPIYARIWIDQEMKKKQGC